MFCRRSYRLAILLVLWVPLGGCNAVTGTADPGSQGSPGSDIGGGDSNSSGGEGIEPGTSGPDNPTTADPPDAQPDELPEAGKGALPDFSIEDVNPDSARYDDVVSPRDYLGRVSAWYFGHAT